MKRITEEIFEAFRNVTKFAFMGITLSMWLLLPFIFLFMVFPRIQDTIDDKALWTASCLGFLGFQILWFGVPR